MALNGCAPLAVVVDRSSPGSSCLKYISYNRYDLSLDYDNYTANMLSRYDSELGSAMNAYPQSAAYFHDAADIYSYSEETKYWGIGITIAGAAAIFYGVFLASKGNDAAPMATIASLTTLSGAGLLGFSFYERLESMAKLKSSVDYYNQQCK